MGHVLNWTPGNQGKGIVTPEGEAHTWNVDRQDGSPIHQEYLENALGLIDTNPHADFNAFEIDAEGKVYEGPSDIDKLDPRLVPTDKWRFQAAVNVVPVGHSGPVGHDGAGEESTPFVYDPNQGNLYVGRPGGYHEDLLSAIPGMSNIPLAIDQPQGRIVEPRVEENVIGEREHMPTELQWHTKPPDNYEEIHQALGADPLSGKWTWAFRAKVGAMVSWEPGKWGKGIYYPETGTLQTWADDRTHPDVWNDDENYSQSGSAHHIVLRPNGTVHDQGAFERDFSDAESDVEGLHRALKELNPDLRLDPPRTNTWAFGPTEPMESEPSAISRGEQGDADHGVQTSNDYAGGL